LSVSTEVEKVEIDMRLSDICGADNVCYVGEMGQNLYTRGLKNMANYRGKQSDSPLWRVGLDRYID
jgi:hypothetical protein